MPLRPTHVLTALLAATAGMAAGGCATNGDDSFGHTLMKPESAERTLNRALLAQAVIDANDAGGGNIGYDDPRTTDEAGDPTADSDLVFGTWIRSTGTFIPRLTDAGLVYANAVRVTTHRSSERENPLPMTFASIVGFTEADVSASSIAMIRGGWKYRGHGFGVVGLDWIQLNGTTRTDSYNPLEGPYAPTEHEDGVYHNDGGGIATNGYIDLVGTTDVYGDARYGPDPDTQDTDYISTNTNSTVTGWQAPLDAELEYPPAVAPSINDNVILTNAGLLDNKNSIKVTGSGAVVIPGGTPEDPNIYVLNDLTLQTNTTVTIDGAVEIYVLGDTDITGNIIVNNVAGAAHPLPANFKLFAVDADGDGLAGDVELGGGSSLFAQVYAPQSNVIIHGTGGEAGLFGAVVGKTINIKGNSAIHYDESTDWNMHPEMDEFWVELVR